MRRQSLLVGMVIVGALAPACSGRGKDAAGDSGSGDSGSSDSGSGDSGSGDSGSSDSGSSDSGSSDSGTSDTFPHIDVPRDLPLFVRYPAGGKGALPVVLYDHGGGIDQDPGRTSVCWGRMFDRAGYVVVHLGHPQPSVDDGAALCEAWGVRDACADLETGRKMVRIQDLHDVLDHLADVDAAVRKATGGAAWIDVDRVAVGGWSAGNFANHFAAGARIRADGYDLTSPLLAFPDPRVKVLLGMSPPGAGSQRGFFCTEGSPGCCVPGSTDACADGTWEDECSWAGVSIPTLLLTGEGDCSEDASGVMRVAGAPGYGSDPMRVVYVTEPGCTSSYSDPGTFGCSGCFLSHETFNLYNGDVCDADGGLTDPGEDTAAQGRYAAARLLATAAVAWLDGHLLGRPEALAWLASDKLEVLSGGFAAWPGDASANGECTQPSDTACLYLPERQYGQAAIGTAGDAETYLTVHVDRW